MADKVEAEDEGKSVGKRYKGKVTQWFTSHQTGFVRCDEFKDEITVHFRNLEGDIARLRHGDDVELCVEKDEMNRPHARRVVLQNPPKRERIRGHCLTWNLGRHSGYIKSIEFKKGLVHIYCLGSEIIQKVSRKAKGGMESSSMDLVPGEQVEFEVENVQGKSQAFNVKRLAKSTEWKKKSLSLKYPFWFTDQTQTETSVVSVCNLPKSVTEQKLSELFGPESIKSIVLDIDSDPLMASALVTFASHEKARNIAMLHHNTYMENSRLELSLKPSKEELDTAFSRMGVDPKAKTIVKFVKIAGPLTRITGGRVFLKRHNQYNKIVLMNAHSDTTSHEVWETFKMLGPVANVELGAVIEGGRKKCYISFVDPTLCDVVAKEYSDAGLNDEYTKFNKEDVEGVKKLGIWEFAKRAKGLSFMGGGLWLKPCKPKRDNPRPGRVPRHDTSTCIYVMNIINGVTETMMGKVFAHLGNIQAVKVKGVSEQCSVGFVYFDSKETVDRILKEYKESKLSDKNEWKKLQSEGEFKSSINRGTSKANSYSSNNSRKRSYSSSQRTMPLYQTNHYAQNAYQQHYSYTQGYPQYAAYPGYPYTPSQHQPHHDQPQPHQPQHRPSQQSPSYHPPSHHPPSHPPPSHHPPQHHPPQHRPPQHRPPQHHPPQHNEPYNHRPKHHKPKHQRPKHHQPKRHRAEHHQSQHHQPRHHQSQHHQAQHHEPQQRHPPRQPPPARSNSYMPHQSQPKPQSYGYPSTHGEAHSRARSPAQASGTSSGAYPQHHGGYNYSQYNAPPRGHGSNIRRGDHMRRSGKRRRMDPSQGGRGMPYGRR